MTGTFRDKIMTVIAAASLVSCSLLAGCTGGQQTGGYEPRMNGDATRGKAELVGYGCGSCHVIPGIHSAQGMVGPPLLYFSRRTMIAGELPNSPQNLVRWIRDPQAIEPGTAMPNLGVPDDKAHDMAAYLYTLR